MPSKRKLFAIFGNPVSHSISPLMHNYAHKGLQTGDCYTRYLLEDPDRLKETFLKLKLSGVNVTVPHKEAAFRACDEVGGIAQQIEAINTIVLEDGKLIGYNTDAPGFFKSAESFGKINSVTILGAGGTAKALAAIFKEKGIKTTIINRSQGRLDYFHERGFQTYTWESFKPFASDLLVNTTSAGLQDESLPAPKEIISTLLENTKYAIDVIYNKNTPFLQMAKAFGVPCKDGSEMLLYQGVIAFDLFYGHCYAQEEITRFMKKAFI